MSTRASAHWRSVDLYDPMFIGAGGSDRASIPLGNGEVCANVWVEEDGVHIYLARSDALTELDRTVKLGEFVVSLDPNPFLRPEVVTQRLRLRKGTLEITAMLDDAPLRISVFIDVKSDAAFVRLHSPKQIDLSVDVHSWRTAPNHAVESAGMFWGDEDRSREPQLAAIAESADIVESISGGIAMHHTNLESIVPGLAKLHGLSEVLHVIPDLILNRTFGSFLSSNRPSEVIGTRMTVRMANDVDVRIATFSSQTISIDQLLEEAQMSWDGGDSEAATTAFWESYWRRSWVFFTGDEGRSAETTAQVAKAASQNRLPTPVPFKGSPITRAYILTKWMTACATRGAMPILYNGSLFTTMPGAGEHLVLASFGTAFTSEPKSISTLDLNPDERSWTIEHLWQNLRLPYYSLLARGEAEGLLPLFSYFRRFWDLDKARARLHHGAAGQWSTEMTLSCGLQSPGIYGVDRRGLEPGSTRNRWGGAINLSPGLELCKLMFDFWRFTKDTEFLVNEIVPYAMDLLDFARSRYFAPESGRLEFAPLNSLETYFDTVNPVAIVSGYHRLVRDLLDLPTMHLSRRDAVIEFQKFLPPLPTETDENGNLTIVPAETYVPTRMNVESPELYSIFPFDLRAQLDRTLLQTTWTKCLQTSGAFRARVIGEELGKPSYAGWQYLAPTAAMLGRVEECLEALANNAALTNPGFAFPAMWGPVYDAVPDVDHGANILNSVHSLIAELIANPELVSILPDAMSIEFRVFGTDGLPIQGRIGSGTLCIDDL